MAFAWNRSYVIAAANPEKLDQALQDDATLGPAGWRCEAVDEADAANVDTFVSVVGTTLTVYRNSTPSGAEITALDGVIASYDTTASVHMHEQATFSGQTVATALPSGYGALSYQAIQVSASVRPVSRAVLVVLFDYETTGAGARMRLKEEGSIVSAVYTLDDTSGAYTRGRFQSNVTLADDTEHRMYSVEADLNGATSGSIRGLNYCLVRI